MTVQEDRSPGTLGPYRLRQRLGEGGMGVVYLAADPYDRLVAVKALRRGVPEEATARRRLAREFDTMRRVHSPYVAEVIDADVEANPPYIVTRYVPGRTVDEVISSGGPLAGPALLTLARGLARALTAVHAAGVVHRDLKPANVMMVDGEPVVIDFGIAQAPDSTKLTMTGMFMGTPGYLAPEVIEGSPSGPAADVHSWGATLAYAATGRAPFGGGTFESIFYRIVNGQPDLTGMPAPLLPLVLHALARDPSRRPSAADLADRLTVLDGSTLVPGSAPAMLPGGALPGATFGDVPAAGMAGMAAAAGYLPAPAANGLAGAGLAGQTAWPPGGTRQFAGGAPDSYADLLPPVSYGRPSPAGTPSPGGNGSGYGGYADAGQQAAGPAATADRPHPPRTPLVLAVVAALIALAVLLPVAGSIIALLVLTALRAADLTSTWRRRGARASGAGGAGGAGAASASTAAGLAYYPVALLRSLIHLVLMLPLALLMAATAAALTFLSAPGHPIPRAGAYA
ncbi:MAG TPA: serine/threonine-protein kinase, partial [Streptosporangiaceae bacterium]